MEPRAARESIVSRLFGFGRKPTDDADPAYAHDAESHADAGLKESAPGGQRGFARTDDAPGPSDEAGEHAGGNGAPAGEPRISVPEQVIRIRTGGLRKRDEVVGAIGDSFRELTHLLGSVSDRLDRQDNRAANLSDQLSEIPDYLRQLPELHAEQNAIARRTVDALSEIPVAQREQAAAVHGLTEKVGEGNAAVRDVAEMVSRIPEAMQLRSQAQEQAMASLAEAQQQTTRVIHHGNQKQLNLFHQATQKTLQTVHQSVKAQRRDMEQILAQSEANMKRMLILTASFMAAALISVIAVLYFK